QSILLTLQCRVNAAACHGVGAVLRGRGVERQFLLEVRNRLPRVYKLIAGRVPCRKVQIAPSRGQRTNGHGKSLARRKGKYARLRIVGTEAELDRPLIRGVIHNSVGLRGINADDEARQARE